MTVHLTYAKLAERWDCSVKVIKVKVRDGDAPPVLTVGGIKRFRLADVEAFEDSHLSSNADETGSAIDELKKYRRRKTA